MYQDISTIFYTTIYQNCIKTYLFIQLSKLYQINFVLVAALAISAGCAAVRLIQVAVAATVLLLHFCRISPQLNLIRPRRIIRWAGSLVRVAQFIVAQLDVHLYIVQVGCTWMQYIGP